MEKRELRLSIVKKSLGEEIQNELCSKCSNCESGVIDCCEISGKKARNHTDESEFFKIKACSSKKDNLKSKSVFRKKVSYLTEASSTINDIEAEYRNRLSNLAHNVDKYAGLTLNSIDAVQYKIRSSSGTLNEIFHQLLTDSPEKWTQFVIDLYKLANAITIEIGAFRKLYGIEPIDIDNHKIHSSTMNVVLPYVSSLKTKGITIIPHECHETVRFDYQIYHAALFAVLENCKKYCLENSKIHINFYTENDKFYVGLKMVSTRIEPKEVDDIFKSEYRSRNARKLEGTGIGLNTAQVLLGKMNAEIIVRTSPYYQDHKYSVNEFIIGIPNNM